MVRFYRYIFLFLVLLVALVWLFVFQLPDKDLHIIACDVGQGDAILIIKGSDQILTDGGPDRKVLDCLGRYLPFWDREIELVILTHPELDHYGGLIEVFRRYKVDNFLYNNIESGSQGYKVLENVVGSEGVNAIRPDIGKELKVGLIRLDIFNPAGDFESNKTNEYSIVYKLSYGDFEALLTGDIEQSISDAISLNKEIGQVEYIKVSHHGSRNGVTENLLKAVVPKLAVISVGKDNNFGHPHGEILKILGKSGSKVLRTDETGDIEVITDGKRYWVRK